MTAARDAAPGFRELITKIIGETIVGDAIDFDFGPVVVPAQDGSMMVGYALICSMRSPLLVPPRIAVNNIIFDGYPTKAQIRESVSTVLQALLEVRQKLCSAGPGPGLN